MTEAECPTQLEVRLASTRNSVPTVRHLVRDVIPEPEVALAEIAMLLVSELVSNSVTHGTTDSSKPVVVDLVLDNRVLHVEVTDYGGGFPPPSAHVGGGEPRANGRGLPLVKILADASGIRPGPPTCVWFEIVRSPVERPLAER
jgi:anti-sigma regulatory factor (Ser/Thr protein kinase)